MPTGAVTPGAPRVSSAAVIQTGNANPSGVVTPAHKGALFQDLTNGTLYQAADVTSGDWVQVGGALGDNGPGVAGAGPRLTASSALNESVTLQDTAGPAGTGNAALWRSHGADGSQTWDLFLGSSGQFHHLWAADGSTSLAGTLLVANVPSGDPHVVGQIYQVAGTLHVSSG